jgi:hypothetical protein
LPCIVIVCQRRVEQIKQTLACLAARDEIVVIGFV